MKPVLNLVFALAFSLLFFSCQKEKAAKKPATAPITKNIQIQKSQLDTIDYNQRMLALSNQDTTGRWPAESPYPLVGAVLPYQRIIAFYGNLYSKRMGVLGEYPKDEMLQKLQSEVAKWQAADSTVQAIPALHYIAVSAQSKPGKANRYNMRMPFKQIDTLLAWAKPIKALVFLDVQIGHSTVKEEVTQLESYLAKPNVHLGIDPEFSMKGGHVPGKKIGTLDASDINDAIAILARIVREKKLPPKVLVVHRFTQGMVTNYQNIKKVPEVQIVMHMDGFGSQILKKSTYLRYIYREPVQFTGFKLFYKNDNWNNWSIYTPEQLVQLTPKPIYIQYQ